MATSCRPDEPQQAMLLPASLQDWLPKGHLAYFISGTIDALLERPAILVDAVHPGGRTSSRRCVSTATA
jgi:hypothetical protein